MGTLKKFRNMYALEGIEAVSDYPTNVYKNFDDSRYIKVKNTSGTENFIAINAQSGNQKDSFITLAPYSAITPIATTDTLANYNAEDYQADSNLTTTFTSSAIVSTVGCKRVFTITISNTSGSDVDVTCFKFIKNIMQVGYGITPHLVMAYYLDTPIKVTNGSTVNYELALTF